MIAPRHPQGPSSPDEDPTGVRALLSSLPEPGPMPPELVERITASLEREQQARAVAGDANVSPLIGRPARTGGSHAGSGRVRRFVAIAGAAAAVVAVATVGTISFLDNRPQVPAAAHVSSQAQDKAAAGGSMAESATPVFFEASGQHYTSSGFGQQAKAMQVSNDTPLKSDALAAPQVKRLGPPMDLTQCIKTLGQQLQARPDKVWVDLGTFDGRPAVIIVVTTDGTSRAWAVGRTCSAGKPSVLAGPTTLT